MESTLEDVASARRDLIAAGRSAGMTDARISLAIGVRLAGTKRPRAADPHKGKGAPTIEQVLQVFVAKMEEHAWKVELDDLLSRRLLKAWVGPRVVAMATVKAVLGGGASLVAIGQAFGRDHSTVHHAVNTAAQQWGEREPKLAKVSRETVRFFR